MGLSSHEGFPSEEPVTGDKQNWSVLPSRPMNAAGGAVSVSRAERASETRYRLVKRVLDIGLAIGLMLIFLPLFALVWLAIRIDSPGSVLYVQERVGARRTRRQGQSTWERRMFRVYKFRSMFDDSGDDLHREYIGAFLNGLPASAEDDEAFKLTNDPRITRVGRFCRRTSIDELPQLINVIKGDMSLVGPRPVPTYEVEGYVPWQLERFEALPGMTGSWQVYGRGRVTFEKMMQMDIEYVRQRSILLDLKLLILTVPAVVRGAGAR